MKRKDLIEDLVNILNTMPEGASNYHIVDMLIGRAERLGMLPPATEYFIENQPEGFQA